MRTLLSKLETHSWPRLFLALVALAVFSLSTPASSLQCSFEQLPESPATHQPHHHDDQPHHHDAAGTSSHRDSDHHHDDGDGDNCCRNNPDASILPALSLSARSASSVEILGISWTALAVLPFLADPGPDAAALYRRDGPPRRTPASQFVSSHLLGRAPPLSA